MASFGVCIDFFLSTENILVFFFHLKKFLISFEAIKVLKSNLQVSLWLIAPLVFYTQLHPTLFSDWTLLYPSLLCLYLNTQPQSAFLSMEFVLFSLWLVSFHSNPISLLFSQWILPTPLPCSWNKSLLSVYEIFLNLPSNEPYWSFEFLKIDIFIQYILIMCFLPPALPSPSPPALPSRPIPFSS